MTFIPLFVALALYPSVPKLWEQHALTHDVLKFPETPVFANVEILRSQVELFRRLPMPALRSQMAVDFQKVNNRDAYPMILELLQEEKNAFVQDDLLYTLKVLKDKGYAVPGGDEVMRGFFTSASPRARGLAIELYLTNGSKSNSSLVLDALNQETSSMVLATALKYLRPLLKQDSVSRLLSLYQAAGEGNLNLKLFALELLAGEEYPERQEALRTALKHRNPLVRMAVARGLSKARKTDYSLLKMAVKDTHTGIRLAALTMDKPDSTQEGILAGCLGDASSTVRSQVARSLGTCGRMTAVESLLNALPDRDHLVRWEIAKALVQLAPTKDYRQKLLQIGESHEATRRQVVYVFHQLADDLGGETSCRWVTASRDASLIQEAVDYLEHVDYKSGVKAVISQASHSKAEIRASVARALGTFERPESYETLKALYRDKDVSVTLAALESMVSIGHPTFAGEFEHAIGTRSDAADVRSYGCRGLAKLKKSSPSITHNLVTLMSKACIPVPMAGLCPDMDTVRISCFMYFLERGMSGDKAAMGIYETQRDWQRGLSQKDPMYNETMLDYLEQLENIRKHEAVQLKKIDYIAPEFSSQALLDAK